MNSLDITKIASGDDRAHSYGCLMLSVDMKNWDDILSTIDKLDIYNKELGYGLLKNPHVTILYGLHDDLIDQEKLQLDIKNAIKNPIKVKLTKISLFLDLNNPYDVVKYEVESELLKRLNKFFKKYKNTNKYPDYKAHITIAYVNSGKGKKYLKKILPILISGKEILYSMADGERKFFKSANTWYDTIKIASNEKKLQLLRKKQFYLLIRNDVSKSVNLYKNFIGQYPVKSIPLVVHNNRLDYDIVIGCFRMSKSILIQKKDNHSQSILITINACNLTKLNFLLKSKEIIDSATDYIAKNYDKYN